MNEFVENETMLELINELKLQVDNLKKELNYYKKYSQITNLELSSQIHLNRNRFLLKEKRRKFSDEKRAINLLYYVYLLDQVCYKLIDGLCDDKDYEVALLAKNLSDQEVLSKRGYKVLLVNKPEFEDNRTHIINSGFVPDVVFSEMPYGVLPHHETVIRPWMIHGEWLPKYYDIFGSRILNQALFCYLPYAYGIASRWRWLKADDDLHHSYGLPFSNFCWNYFSESQRHHDLSLRENNTGNCDNHVIAGYPKYDDYMTKDYFQGDFKWNSKPEEKKRIVYAPHFFRSDQYLENTLKILLELAKLGKHEIIVKPHPNPNNIIKKYEPIISKASGIRIIENGAPSQYLFGTTDLIIVSSVSMHADALFSGKPFISELTEDHFNEVGLDIKKCGYSYYNNLEKDAELIKNLSMGRADDKKKLREKLISELTPHGSDSTQFIISYIKNELFREV